MSSFVSSLSSSHRTSSSQCYASSMTPMQSFTTPSQSSSSLESSVSSPQKSLASIHFRQMEDGYEEINGTNKFSLKRPYDFLSVHYVKTQGDIYPISLVGRVALADDLPFMQILSKSLPEKYSSLPLQTKYEPYSAFHWSLLPPDGKVCSYLLRNTTIPLVCNFSSEKETSYCETCTSQAMKAVEEVQKDIGLSSVTRSVMQDMHQKLSDAQKRICIKQLPGAWRLRDLEKIKTWLQKGGDFEKDLMGRLLIEGAEAGFDEGIVLLLDKDPSLVNYSISEDNISGITALHKADAYQNESTSKLLISRGADPKTKAWALRSRKRPWSSSKEKPDKTYLEYGLVNRINRTMTSMVKHAKGHCDLSLSCLRGRKNHSKEWNVIDGIDMNARLCKGKTQTFLEFFIKEYSLFNSYDLENQWGTTVNLEATFEVIDFVLELGADPGLSNEEGISLLDWIKKPKDQLIPYFRTITKATLPGFQKIVQRLQLGHQHAKLADRISQEIMDYVDTSTSESSNQCIHLVKKIFVKSQCVAHS